MLRSLSLFGGFIHSLIFKAPYLKCKIILFSGSEWPNIQHFYAFKSSILTLSYNFEILQLFYIEYIKFCFSVVSLWCNIWTTVLRDN